MPVKLTVRWPGNEVGVGELNRLTNGLATLLREQKPSYFAVDPATNCASLLARQVDRQEVMIQFTLETATVRCFTLSVEDTHCGWIFLLPKHGTAVCVANGLIYVRPDFDQLREKHRKKVRMVSPDPNKPQEGQLLPGLDPDIYLPHADFHIYGVGGGDILTISKDSTHVITQ